MVKQTVQQRDGGSNPTSPLHFSQCKLRDVYKFVDQHHYSKTHPSGADLCFKMTTKDFSLVGAALFGYSVNPAAVCVTTESTNQHDYRELVRLVLLDEVPKNSESQFIGWCLRWLKKNTKLLAVVSFADPQFGHTGIIYQASNWLYTGLQKQDRPRMLINGTEIHPRSLYAKYGTSSKSKLEDQFGFIVTLKHRTPKHRYVYILHGSKTYLKYPLRSYPKRGDVKEVRV